MKFLVIGKCYTNIIAPIEEDIQMGELKNIEKYITVNGGSSLITAKTLRNLNAEVIIATVICNDTYGKNILVSLKNDGVITESVELDYERNTPVINTYINTKNRNTLTIKLESDNLVLKKPKYATTPNAIITDGSDMQATNYAFNQFNTAPRILNYNLKNKDINKLIKFVNYVIISQDDAENISKMKFDYNNNISFAKIYQFLKDTFNKEIIVTLNNGGVLYNIENQVKIMPGLKVNSVDNSSYHDVFVGAYAYNIISGKTKEESITNANIIASLSTTKFGTTNSVPTAVEVNNFLKQVNEVGNNNETQHGQTQNQ